MTNFDFLKNETQFGAFSDSCIEAEKSISVSTEECGISRQMAVLR